MNLKSSCQVQGCFPIYETSAALQRCEQMSSTHHSVSKYRLNHNTKNWLRRKHVLQGFILMRRRFQQRGNGIEERWTFFQFAAQELVLILTYPRIENKIWRGQLLSPTQGAGWPCVCRSWREEGSFPGSASESDVGSSGVGAILTGFFFFFNLFAMLSPLKITESNPVWVSITGK